MTDIDHIDTGAVNTLEEALKVTRPGIPLETRAHFEAKHQAFSPRPPVPPEKTARVRDLEHIGEGYVNRPSVAPYRTGRTDEEARAVYDQYRRDVEERERADDLQAQGVTSIPRTEFYHRRDDLTGATVENLDPTAQTQRVAVASGSLEGIHNRVKLTPGQMVMAERLEGMAHPRAKEFLNRLNEGLPVSLAMVDNLEAVVRGIGEAQATMPHPESIPVVHHELPHVIASPEPRLGLLQRIGNSLERLLGGSGPINEPAT